MSEKSDTICEQPQTSSAMDEIVEIESSIISSERDGNKTESEDREYDSDSEDSSIRSFLIIFKDPIKPPTKCETCLYNYTPTCPPPVCSMLTEQVIVFFILVIVFICIFLIYWFVED